MPETQKLISNLKKEIEKYERWIKEENNSKRINIRWSNEIEIIKAQLQFAEKLMKLRDKEEKERLKKLIEKIKKDIKKIKEVDLDLGGAGIYVRVRELNKILDEAKWEIDMN